MDRRQGDRYVAVSLLYGKACQGYTERPKLNIRTLPGTAGTGYVPEGYQSSDANITNAASSAEKE